MQLITLGIIGAILFVVVTLLFERYVPQSVKQTLNDMIRVIKGK